jgi:hypothetical protein
MKRRLRTLCILVITACTLASCGPKVMVNVMESRPTTAYNLEVKVLTMEDKIPSELAHLGTVHIGESGFTVKCSYDYVMQLVNEESRKIGGTLIRITEHKRPDLWSSCHRITADVYAPK